MITDKITHITTRIVNNNDVDTNITQEIIELTNIILEQNYFQFDNKFYKQKRLSNGSTHIRYII